VYAYQDPKVRSLIKEIEDAPKFSSKTLRKISKLILESEGNQKLIHEIEDKISLELKNHILNKENRVGKEATLLLRALCLK
jgi:hypothetical protein